MNLKKIFLGPSEANSEIEKWFIYLIYVSLGIIAIASFSSGITFDPGSLESGFFGGIVLASPAIVLSLLLAVISVYKSEEKNALACRLRFLFFILGILLALLPSAFFEVMDSFTIVTF